MSTHTSSTNTSSTHTSSTNTSSTNTSSTHTSSTPTSSTHTSSTNTSSTHTSSTPTSSTNTSSTNTSSTNTSDAGSDSSALLSDDDLAFYETNGYLLLESYLSSDWVARLQQASDEFVALSKTMTASDGRLDLEPDHTADRPRLRRLLSPVDNHPTFAEFALNGPAAELAVALLGEPARFHHSKLNYKWSNGGQAVHWHQDIQYWPHTDFSPLTIGIYLNDVDDAMGPMGIVPESQRGELFDLYDDAGAWTGSIREDDLERVAVDSVVWLRGPAGSATVHNCGAIHGSTPNTSQRVRPLLLQTYSAADSFPLMGVGATGRTGKLTGTLVGQGSAPRWLTIGGRTMPAAPDWSRGGYTTIFDVQNSGDESTM